MGARGGPVVPLLFLILVALFFPPPVFCSTCPGPRHPGLMFIVCVLVPNWSICEGCFCFGAACSVPDGVVVGHSVLDSLV